MLIELLIIYLLVGAYLDLTLLYVAYRRGYLTEPGDIAQWIWIEALAYGLLAWPVIIKNYIEADL
jgi:hypothetical protein